MGQARLPPRAAVGDRQVPQQVPPSAPALQDRGPRRLGSGGDPVLLDEHVVTRHRHPDRAVARSVDGHVSTEVLPRPAGALSPAPAPSRAVGQRAARTARRGAVPALATTYLSLLVLLPIAA